MKVCAPFLARALLLTWAVSRRRFSAGRRCAGLQLALLIDDSSNASFSPQLNDVENFIEALPPTTQIAVGYMQNGRANIAQSFTNSHGSAASALWAPMSMTEAIPSRYPYGLSRELI